MRDFKMKFIDENKPPYPSSFVRWRKDIFNKHEVRNKMKTDAYTPENLRYHNLYQNTLVYLFIGALNLHIAKIM